MGCSLATAIYRWYRSTNAWIVCIALWRKSFLSFLKHNNYTMFGFFQKTLGNNDNFAKYRQLRTGMSHDSASGRNPPSAERHHPSVQPLLLLPSLACNDNVRLFHAFRRLWIHPCLCVGEKWHHDERDMEQPTVRRVLHCDVFAASGVDKLRQRKRMVLCTSHSVQQLISFVKFQCKRIATAVHKMISHAHYDKGIFRELESFSQQLNHHASRISSGLCDFDWTLLYSVRFGIRCLWCHRIT